MPGSRGRPWVVWEQPPGRPVLERGDVHVWRASLAPDADTLAILRALLSPDEHARAARFHFPRDRDAFATARGVLRVVLATYLDERPAEIAFRYTEYGKPMLSTARDVGSLRFNVSHARGVALCAVARETDIGVDVERIRDDFPITEIAERFFSRDEAEGLAALPTRQRYAAFFDIWTRKEAYIKARGEGLSHALESFSVTRVPGTVTPVLETIGDFRSHWSLEALDPGPGYAAALAVEGRIGSVRCWQWSAG